MPAEMDRKKFWRSKISEAVAILDGIATDTVLQDFMSQAPTPRWADQVQKTIVNLQRALVYMQQWEMFLCTKQFAFIFPPVLMAEAAMQYNDTDDADGLQDYTTCALWADYNSDSNISDFDSDLELSDVAKHIMRRDWIKFWRMAKQFASCYGEQLDAKQTAHDFWLTRQGHGCGFWEADHTSKELGKALTALSKCWPELYFYVNNGAVQIDGAQGDTL